MQMNGWIRMDKKLFYKFEHFFRVFFSVFKIQNNVIKIIFFYMILQKDENKDFKI